MRPNGQHILDIVQYRLYCITSFIPHQMFIDKISFKNFKEQVQSFLNVTGDSLVHKTRPCADGRYTVIFYKCIHFKPYYLNSHAEH